MFANCGEPIPQSLRKLPLFRTLEGKWVSLTPRNVGNPPTACLFSDNIYAEQGLQALFHETLSNRTLLSSELPQQVGVALQQQGLVATTSTLDLLCTDVVDWLCAFRQENESRLPVFQLWMTKLATISQQNNMSGIQTLKNTLKQRAFLHGKRCSEYADPRQKLISALVEKYNPLPPDVFTGADDDEWMAFLVEMGLTVQLSVEDCFDFYKPIQRTQDRDLANLFWKYVCENQALCDAMRSRLSNNSLFNDTVPVMAAGGAGSGGFWHPYGVTADDSFWNAAPDIIKYIEDPELRRLWKAKGICEFDRCSVCIRQVQAVKNHIHGTPGDMTAHLSQLRCTFDDLERSFSQSPTAALFGSVCQELLSFGTGSNNAAMVDFVAEKWCMLVDWSGRLGPSGFEAPLCLACSCPEARLPCEGSSGEMVHGSQIAVAPGGWDEGISGIGRRLLHPVFRDRLKSKPLLWLSWVGALQIPMRHVLFVGEGDLSFARCAWRRLCIAGAHIDTQFVVTTFDSEERIRSRYDPGALIELQSEATQFPQRLILRHGVDACALRASSFGAKFDQLIWNFPNSDGLDWERKTRELVDKFLCGVTSVLAPHARIVLGCYLESNCYWEKIYGLPFANFDANKGLPLETNPQLQLGSLIRGWHEKFFREEGGYQWQMTKGKDFRSVLHDVWDSLSSVRQKTTAVVLVHEPPSTGDARARVPEVPELRERDVYDLGPGGPESLWSPRGTNDEELEAGRAALQRGQEDLVQQQTALQEGQTRVQEERAELDREWERLRQEEARLMAWEVRLVRWQQNLSGGGVDESVAQAAGSAGAGQSNMHDDDSNFSI